MAMAGRHIRHDWQTFVEWDQKSVRTVCGRTSTFNATGIPGVTDQPQVVVVGDKRYPGWCTMCARLAYITAGNALMSDSAPDLHPYIVPMYEDVFVKTTDAHLAYLARQAAHRKVR